MKRLLLWCLVAAGFAFIAELPTLMSQEKTPTTPLDDKCSLAVVEWSDATLYTKSNGFAEDNHLTPQVSVGCAVKKKDSLVLVFNVSAGNPDSWLAIPYGWITRIVLLKADKEVSDGKPPPEKAK